MNRLLAAFRQETEKESRKKAISEVQTYINNQWSGIRAMRKYDRLLVGCSAEGSSVQYDGVNSRSRVAKQ
jgi:hypothetical protein